MNDISIKQRKHAQGFTLLELMVSLVILAMLALFAGQLYINYTNASRDVKAANLVYEEGRFLMERIIREVRQNAIDYEEYFSKNVVRPYQDSMGEGPGKYGDNYCSYSSFFYDDNGESIGERNSTMSPLYEAAAATLDGDLNAEAINPIEDELYLISTNGLERTFITRVVKEEVPGIESGKVAMLKMVGKDFGEDGIDSKDSYNDGGATHDPNCVLDDREGDGKVDTWLCDPDFPCDREVLISNPSMNCEGYTHEAVNDPSNPNHSFVDLSPSVLDVLDLRFMITPPDDPWKAYRILGVQIQPHVTIQMVVQAHKALVDSRNRPQLPSITLTSTISARNYDEINSDCR